MRRVAFALGFSIILASGAARAQTPSEIATAKQWFADGLGKEEKGDYAGALDLFRRAVQVKKTPQILYHVGFCESRTGALVEALVDLDGAAALARSAGANDVVGAAQGELADVKKRIPSVEVHPDATAKPSRFVVDGSSVALSMVGAPMPLNPGEHTLSVEYTSGQASQKVTLAERDAKVVDMPAPAGGAAPVAVVPVTPPPAVVTPAERPETTKESPSRVLPWVLTLGGGALFLGGGALVAVAQVKARNLDGCKDNVCPPSAKADYDSDVTLDTVGIVGLAGVVAAGVGITMLAMGPSEPAHTGLYLTPNGVGATF